MVVIGCNWLIQADKTVGCAPCLNHPEHDFPVPGYHLIPSGYIQLVCPVDVLPANECILEPSLNDFSENTAGDRDDFDVDGSEDYDVQSDADSFNTHLLTLLKRVILNHKISLLK